MDQFPGVKASKLFGRLCDEFEECVIGTISDTFRNRAQKYAPIYDRIYLPGILAIRAWLETGGKKNVRKDWLYCIILVKIAVDRAEISIDNLPGNLC